MDIEILDFKAPEIKINYEDLEKELEIRLKDYEGIVVTQETLAGCKNAQKELAGLKRKIDRYRIDKKKEIEAPIKVFEQQCKHLVSLIENVEVPIKEGIKHYDDEKRKEKYDAALKIKDSVVEKAGLNEKYANMLTIIDKYQNLSSSKKSVQEDLETRAFALKVEQEREEEKIHTISEIIKIENERINSKLSIEDFEYEINQNKDASEIIRIVKKRADMIYNAENPPVEETKEVEDVNETKNESIIEKSVEDVVKEKEEAPIFKVSFDVIGTKEQQHLVADFMKKNRIDYKVTDQRKVWLNEK